MENSAFVGVSLDSSEFCRDWIRYAVEHLLSRHRDIEFVFGDRLLEYNKTARQDGGRASVDFIAAASKIAKRRNDVRLCLESEVRRLSPSDQLRVTVKLWDHYSDAVCSNLARKLTIAYSVIPEFRSCVDHDVEAHFVKHLEVHTNPETGRHLCSRYVLEETAMIIRITELAGRPFDYYPGEQIETLRSIYQDQFSADGLSLQTLIGRQKSRIFTPLYLNSMACQRFGSSAGE